MKKIAILGSTGSIGTQTLEVVRENRDLQVVALSAGKNIDLLEKQIREFHPKLVSLQSEEACKELAQRVKDLQVEIIPGMEGLLAIAQMEESEILVTAIVGMIGIRPTIAAIQKKKDIALANKETLVTAGHIIMPLAERMGVKILPVDSEHSAIFQSLQGEPKNRVDKLLITASGGPFRGRTREQLANIQVEDALKHPNWDMGAKITIDSSTLVNKGLEVMEAKWLFDVDLDHIQVVVHPQSIIHSMVQYVDGGIIAQLGTPDMKLPIQYALFYPDRRPMGGKRVDFYELGQITFEKPDMDTFVGLKLAMQAAREGGSMPTVFNAANEKAVSLFLNRKISYLQITDAIQYALFYPDRRPMGGKRVDFYELGQITFEKPDMDTFVGLKLAMQAAREGGSMPTVFNAANEKAVSLFLNRKISYLQITDAIEYCMQQHQKKDNPNVEEILQAEQFAYECIASKFGKL